jgi:hypothetical protein
MRTISKGSLRLASERNRGWQQLSTVGKAGLSARGGLLSAVAAVMALCIATASCMAQDETAGGRARAQGRRSSSARLEATSYIQWSRAPIDTSHGAETYWLHVSGENMGGRTSGGFTIDMHPRVSGKLIAVTVKAPPGGKAASAGPTVAKITGSCSYEGKNYTLEFDVVADQWKPSPTPGVKGSSVKGSIRVKLIDAATKTVSEAQGARQTSVKIWQN